MAVVVMVEEQEEKVDGREKTHGGLRIGMDSLGEALLNGENPSIFLIIPDLQTPSASPFIRLSQSLFLSRSRFSAFHAVTQLCTRCNHKCNATTGTPPPRSLARSLVPRYRPPIRNVSLFRATGVLPRYTMIRSYYSAASHLSPLRIHHHLPDAWSPPLRTRTYNNELSRDPRDDPMPPLCPA